MQNLEETTSLAERIAYIEGQIPFLATKADLADLAAQLTAKIGSLDAKVTALEATLATTAWGLGLGLAVLNMATVLGGVFLGAYFNRRQALLPESARAAKPSALESHG